VKHLIVLLLPFIFSFPAFSQNSSSISGYMTDAESSDTLIAANVALSYGAKGTSTNASGYYRLPDIKPGRYTIISSYLGYENFERDIVLKPGESLRLNIRLKPKAYKMEEVVIESIKEKEKQRDIGIAFVETSFIKDLPAMFEDDVFRSLQLLPGVKASSDISSGLYIRGGSPDQTLILFDQATVYNPSHFFGFYSTFNPNAIESVNLYKGNYPAEFGGRLGSVVSISSKDGNRDRFESNLSIGLLASGVSLSGPLKEGKGSWMFSTRRSTLEPVLEVLQKSYSDIPESFYFLDLNGKIDIRYNANNKLSLSFYSGNDKLQFPFAEDAGIKLSYGNQVISSNWTHIYSDKVISEFSLSASRYFNFPSFNIASTPFERSNNIYDYSFKANTEYIAGERHDFLFGVWIESRRLSLEDRQDHSQTFSSDHQSLHGSFYFQDNWMISGNLTFSPGLRVNSYGENKPLRFEPRVSLEYRPSSRLRLQAAYGEYSQFLTLVSNESFSGLDVWLMAKDGVATASGSQYALGLKTIPWKGYGLDMELYYRSMNNLFEPDPNIQDWAGMPYKELFRYGDGYAYGMELLFERKIGRLTGFMGYTMSVTRRRFPDVSDATQQEGSAKYYPTKFDRSHDFNLVMGYKLNARWSASAVFSLASGQPYTKPLGRSKTFNSPLSATDKPQVISGKVNASRLPAYHRFDVGFTRSGSFFGMGEAKWQAQIINVYSRRNVWFYQFNLGDHLAERDEVRLLPVLPSITYSLNF